MSVCVVWHCVSAGSGACRLRMCRVDMIVHARGMIGVSIARDEGNFVLIKLVLESTLGGRFCKKSCTSKDWLTR